MTHTNFTEVTWVVFVEIGSEKLEIQLQWAQKHDVARTDDDVDHRQDHDLLDAYGACLHVRDRPIRGHGAYGFSRIEMALFSVKDNLQSVY